MQQFKIGAPLFSFAALLVIVGCSPDAPPTGPAAPAAKVADPFTNSAYHFSFDLRWHGPVPRLVKREVQRAADDLGQILRFNSLLPSYLYEYNDLEINGLPDSIGGEWVYNKVVVYVSHSSWSGVEIGNDNWGLGAAVLKRAVNGGGLFYKARPLVGKVILHAELPVHKVYNVALHELVHVMGFGPAFLEENDGDPPHTGYKDFILSAGNKYFWRGGMAKTVYGVTSQDWKSKHVPLHTDKAHWDASIADLMHPTGGSLTTLTLGFLADLGYVVDDEDVQSFSRAAAKPPVSDRGGELAVRRCGVSLEWLRANGPASLAQASGE